MIKATKRNLRTVSASYCARKSVRGFTLIELVVVIAIILLLLSLVLAVGLSARSQAESREMQNILLLVDTAIKEWELISERKLSWGRDDDPTGSTYDIQGYDSQGDEILPAKQLDQALARIQKVDSVKQILASIDSNFLKQIEMDNDQIAPHLIDPWGKEVCLIHPGSISYVNPPQPDVDGTIRTENENFYGVAVNRTLLLVSAGPDGLLGNLDPESQDYDPKAASDNIYSYRPESN